MKYPLLIISLLLVEVCAPYAQDQNLVTVDSFQWLPEHNVFRFQGKSQFPPTTELLVSLSLNRKVGRVQFVRVKKQSWEGHFGPFTGKTLLPGDYVLKVEIQEKQQPEKVGKNVQELLAGKKLEVTRTCSYNEAKKKEVWKELEDDLYQEIMKYRPYLDLLYQQSQRILWKAAQSTPEQKMALGREWEKIYASLPDFKQRQEELAQRFREKFVIFPYANSLERLTIALDRFQQLKELVSRDIGNATGVQIANFNIDSPVPAPSMVIDIRINVKKALDELHRYEYWRYTLETGGKKIPKERGKFDAQRKIYVSPVSKFRFGFETMPKQVRVGEEGAAGRLSMLFDAGSIPAFVTEIQMIRFPNFETEDEKVKAWELLASYEWENYQKAGGRFVTVTNETTQRPNRYYELTFTSDVGLHFRLVKCHLYFSPKRKDMVYGVVYINLLGTEMDHHFSTIVKKNLEKIVNTFEILE